ncbi:glycoside hydrolase family 113 [Salinibacter altiplanensis]|uniref:glycoside hydrolase family 113 n=1 Tax=Salinibacter altiplanensis TaxID=1803181 RepID=UPI000C9FEFC4|nr:hypothetical protein [Salinibacter altiplanensis]
MRRPLHCLCLATGLALGVLLVAGAGCGDTTGASPAAADTRPDAKPIFDVRSVTLDARTRPDSSLLVRLRDLGVTHPTLVAFGWQKAPDSPTVRVDTGDGWYSESHRGIRTLARQADALGMGVILKPHLWVGGYDETQDRSTIGFESDARWREWEANYRRFLLLYARLAAEVDADALVLGTELTRAATERPHFWRGLADSVRAVYDGKLTYAANWHEAYERIQFWDALDYVGVQAYFPLTEAEDPSLAALQEGWRPHRAALAKIHERTGRPILLTEIGYRSAVGAAAAPWEWPERDDGAVPDSALQARCYRAFLSTVGRAPWLKGGIIWKWHPPGEVEGPTAFTPQAKPAEDVLRRWFTGATADSGRTASPAGGSPGTAQ